MAVARVEAESVDALGVRSEAERLYREMLATDAGREKLFDLAAQYYAANQIEEPAPLAFEVMDEDEEASSMMAIMNKLCWPNESIPT